MNYELCDCWAFAWHTGQPRPYLTTIASHTRRDLIHKVESYLGQPWQTTYRQGGRAVKCQIVQKESQ